MAVPRRFVRPNAVRASASIASLLLAVSASLAGTSERIRLNQVGFAVGAPKFAVSLDSGSVGQLVDASTGTIAFEAPMGKAIRWSAAEDTGRLFDFSSFDRPGTYYVKIGDEISHPVRVAASPFLELARGTAKAYWYTRSSYAPAAPWAGPYARAAGHPDTAVRIHASAATAARPKNTLIRSTGGWYDAGDYGKYVVNSGITTWTLLRLHEVAPAFFDTLTLDVPPHAAPSSDLLDEILWNLRWMLSMQDPFDGGVYHKLTTAGFPGSVMPDKDIAVRYVVQKSTAATLDMAAVAAFAARLFKDDPSLKGLSDSCLAASLAAWKWARTNPDSLYDQDASNAEFSPSITTGTYDNADLADEFTWAASELFLATGIDSFATAIDLAKSIRAATTWTRLGWEYVGTLGWISLASHPEALSGSLAGLAPVLDSGLAKTARTFAKPRSSTAYHLNQISFWWGSAGTHANTGLVEWEAWRRLGDTTFRNASLDALDYVLGRNATGYGFVTGFGSKTPLDPHNRISEGDTVTAPIPGLVVGGPNGTAATDDGCGYPSDLEPRIYLDDRCSYSTNENSINQNAPVAYLAGVWSAYLSGGSLGVAPSLHRAASGLSMRTRGTILEASLSDSRIVVLEIRALDGSLHARAAGERIDLGRIPTGLLLVVAKDASGTVHAAKTVLR